MVNQNLATDKLSKILRCDKDTLLDLDKKMCMVSGKSKVLDKIVEETMLLLMTDFLSWD